MINKFIGIGYLASDPKSQTFSSKSKCSFAVAINSTQTEVIFLDIEAWDKVGANCEKFLKKGSCIYLEGKLKINKWEGKDGVERYTTETVASEMQMLGGRSGGGSAPASAPSQESRRSSPAPASSASDGDFDDDIPF